MTSIFYALEDHFPECVCQCYNILFYITDNDDQTKINPLNPGREDGPVFCPVSLKQG